MATTADGQWNQKDKLWLSLAFEINRKLVDTSTLYNPKKLVLRQSITNDFFFPPHTNDLCRDSCEELELLC